MSVLGLVLLSMTPIAAFGFLLGIDRFERYLLEGDVDQTTGVAVEAAPPPIAPSVTAQPVAQASRPAA